MVNGMNLVKSNQDVQMKQSVQMFDVYRLSLIVYFY